MATSYRDPDRPRERFEPDHMDFPESHRLFHP